MNKLSIWSTIIILLAFVGCKSRTNFHVASVSKAADKGATKVQNSENLTKKLEQVFSSTTVESNKLDMEIDNLTVVHNLKMKQYRYKSAQTYTQIERPLITQRFTQGQVGDVITKNFQQNESGILDILIVIDNSSSMRHEQENVSTKLQSLLTYVKDSNWQIGVVTTDPADPCTRGIVKKGDSDAEEAFKKAINAGISGDGTEQGVRQAVVGLQCYSNSWLRDDSTLAVLIISDEDNCSNRTQCGDQPWSTPDFLLDYLEEIRTPKVDARVYGLFWVPGKSCSTAYFEAIHYQELVDATDGTSGSVCEEDYSDILSSISENVADILKNQFDLGSIPDAGSIKVYVNDELQLGGYSVSGQTLNFNPSPAKGSEIRVEFTKGSSEVISEFQLSHQAAIDTLRITANGTAIDATKFEYDAATQLIAFAEPPAANAEVVFVYREDRPLLDKFFVGNRVADPKGIRLLANREPLDYDYIQGKVIARTPPPDSSTITLSFEKLGDPVLAYMFSNENGIELEAVDKETGDGIHFEYFEEYIVFDEEDFKVDREIQIVQKYDTLSEHGFELPHTPIANTVKVTAGDVVCEGADVEIDGKNATFKCNFKQYSNLEITYDHITAHHQEFKMEQVKRIDNTRWTVLQNGKPAEGFKRKGTTIAFDEELPPQTEIKIIVEWDNDNPPKKDD